MSWNRGVELHGHPLALRLAREELEGSPDQWLSVTDWGERIQRHQRTLRSFGVVVAASADGLHHLDRHLYRPLRDASFLTVKLLDDQVRERVAGGAPPRAAFDHLADSWLRYFGELFVQGEQQRTHPDESPILEGAPASAAIARYLSAPRRLDLLWGARQAVAGRRASLQLDPAATREQELRVSALREAFGACDADFLGPGGHELVRVIFATVWLLSDDLSRVPRTGSGDRFEGAYRRVVGRFKAVAARLVCGDVAPAS
jgi:hypothetical protein